MKQKMKFCAMPLMLLFGGLSANAATYYVDQNNAQASDSNSGTTELLPWKTLTKGVKTAVAGDTVVVKAGTYVDLDGNMEAGFFNPVNSGTTSAPITFRSEPRLAAILAPKAAGVDPAIDIFQRSSIVIDGFTVTGMILVMSSDHVTVKNCEVIHGSTIYQDPSLNWGIALEGSSYSIVRNNYVHDMLNSGNTGHNTAGIMVFGGSGSTFSSFNIVENNLVDAGGGTVYSAYGQKAGNITNNIWRYNIAANATVGFLGMGSTDSARYSDDNEFYQNIIHNSKYGFELDHGSRRFKIYNNTTAGVDRFLSSNFASNVDARVWNNIAVSATPGPNDAAYWSGGYPSQQLFPSLIAHADHNCFSGFARLGYREQSPAQVYTTLTAWQTTTGLDGSSIVADPQFVNAAAEDFHLASGSACATAGMDEQDHDGDGNTTEAIPAGVYITGAEIIGRVSSGDTLAPAAPSNLTVQ